MPQDSHFIRVNVRLYPDSAPLPADQPRHQSMWLGPLTDPVVAAEMAKRFRTTYVSADPQVTLHPEAPADVNPIPIDETFLSEPDLVEAVRRAAETRRNVVADQTTASDPTDGSDASTGEPEGVDWRTIFVKYRNFVGNYEGIDFLGHVDDTGSGNPFTPAEWAALNEACDEADRAAAQAHRAYYGN